MVAAQWLASASLMAMVMGGVAAAFYLLGRRSQAMLRATHSTGGAKNNETCQQTNNFSPPGSDRLEIFTGLDSREAIEGTIGFLLALKARYNNEFSLVLAEIDHFETFKNEHGPDEGNRVLRRLADMIRESTRDTDAAGRFDGQEVVIVLPETSLEGACNFGERLRHAVDQGLPISISCGIATAADGDTAKSILSRADSALLSAVSAGKNRVFKHTGRSINLVTSQVTEQVLEEAEPEPTIPTLEAEIDDENAIVSS